MARILLVDDEEDVRVALAEALTLAGHHVDTAASASEALSLADSTTYSVAVIDYVLPGKKGLDLLHSLRAKDPFIRSIIISGQIDHDVLDAAEVEKQLRNQIAADRYLSKPTSVSNLLSSIEEVLQSSSAGDWQQMAEHAVSAHAVTKKKVGEADRNLRAIRKKR